MQCYYICARIVTFQTSIWEVLASENYGEMGMNEYGCGLDTPCRIQIEGNAILFLKIFSYYWFLSDNLIMGTIYCKGLHLVLDICPCLAFHYVAVTLCTSHW